MALLHWTNIFSYAVIRKFFLNTLLMSPYLMDPTPIGCLQNDSPSTLESLISCFDAYTVSKDFYSSETYAAAQPTQSELVAWEETILSLLSVDENCTDVTVPSAISDFYSVASYADRNGPSYCVLSETTSNGSFYTKGWGLVVVPALKSSVKRHIHLSAPHPTYDLNTPQQAAALFQAVEAKSLLIDGRSRLALREKTDCITSSKAIYYTTDPAHNKNEPFFSASKTIKAWQESVGGCPSSSCAYIQLHGKGASTCRTDQMFLSSGLANSSSSFHWYTNEVDRPVKRLHHNLRLAFPQWNVSLPSDSSCSLTATTNVFGRLVNGIDENRVCYNGSNARLATGEFVHVEQAAAARASDAYDAWATALKETFPAVEEERLAAF